MTDSLPRIFITGFMGAGKTVAAAALASLLGCRALDLDQFVKERAGRTPQRIIDESGEALFREIESMALREVLREGSARVVALGGGTWTIERNRALINESGGLTVWLDAPFELCWRRIEAAGDTRPLGRTREEALLLFDARRALYELADVRLEVYDEMSAMELAAEIARRLRQTGAGT